MPRWRDGVWCRTKSGYWLSEAAVDRLCEFVDAVEQAERAPSAPEVLHALYMSRLREREARRCKHCGWLEDHSPVCDLLQSWRERGMA